MKEKFTLEKEELKFEMEKQLIELRKKAELEVEEIKHKNHIDEILLDKNSKMELQRIKTAEIRKTIERQSDKNFMESYHK